MSEQTGLEEKKVRECAHDLCHLLNGADKKPATVQVFKKFSHQKFLEVAKIIPQIEQKWLGLTLELIKYLFYW